MTDNETTTATEPSTPRLVRRLHYLCQNTKCFGDGPKDVTTAIDTVGIGEVFAETLTCHHCHGGLGQSPEVMKQRQEGLRFLYEETIDLKTGRVVEVGERLPWAPGAKGPGPTIKPFRGLSAAEIAKKVN